MIREELLYLEITRREKNLPSAAQNRFGDVRAYFSLTLGYNFANFLCVFFSRIFSFEDGFLTENEKIKRPRIKKEKCEKWSEEGADEEVNFDDIYEDETDDEQKKE